MDRFARWVLGYHGCSAVLAHELLTGARSVRDWPASANDYDWLGHGIYFWEHGPERALQWAHEHHRDTPAVVGAIIQLGHCFDLLDTKFTSQLLPVFERQRRDAGAAGTTLRANRGPDGDLGGRFLDCFVINACLEELPDVQTVRCAFREGEPAFPGAMIFRESHIQIAVRDPDCVLGVFRPT
ncbi:MAG: hypothetical protein KF773_07215 [Deltaproteobacteria bacterium]|nr:hypothetical protein [Deltaproteobacteria bacterium]